MIETRNPGLKIDKEQKRNTLFATKRWDEPMEERKFEEALEELKEIVQTLERGDKPLDEALALFERGVSLVAWCTKRLDEVESKVEALLRTEAGQLKTCPFEEISTGNSRESNHGS